MTDRLQPSNADPHASASGASDRPVAHHRVVVFFVILAVAFSGLRYSYESLRVCLHRDEGFHDFAHFYFFAGMIHQGKPYWDKQAVAEHDKQFQHVYHGADSFYLPGLYLAFSPIAYLDFDTASLVWGAVNQIVLFAALSLIVATLRLHHRPIVLAAFAFMVFNYYPLRLNAECGQTNCLCLLWFALSLFFYTRDRHLAAGAALALAAVTKFTPAIALSYFIWKRQFKVCLGFMVALIAIILLPMLVLGVDAQIHQTKEFFFHARLHSYPGWPVHHAFGNAVARILLEPGRRLTAAELRLVNSIVAVFTLGVFAIAGWITWPRKSEHPQRPAFEFALALTTPLVVGSIVEIHHFVWLLIPFALLLSTPPRAQPRHFWLWLGAIYAVLALEYWPDRFKILHYGIPSIVLMGKWLAVCAIWGLIAVVLERFRSCVAGQGESREEAGQCRSVCGAMGDREETASGGAD